MFALLLMPVFFFCRWSKMAMNFLPNGSWWRSFLPQTTVASLIMQVQWWVWMRLSCALSRWGLLKMAQESALLPSQLRLLPGGAARNELASTHWLSPSRYHKREAKNKYAVVGAGLDLCDSKYCLNKWFFKKWPFEPKRFIVSCKTESLYRDVYLANRDNHITRFLSCYETFLFLHWELPCLTF